MPRFILSSGYDAAATAELRADRRQAFDTFISEKVPSRTYKRQRDSYELLKSENIHAERPRHHVVECAEDKLETLAANLPDGCILEADQPRHPLGSRFMEPDFPPPPHFLPPDVDAADLVKAPHPGTGTTLSIQVISRNAPVAGVKGYLALFNPSQQSAPPMQEGTSDEQGWIRFTYSSQYKPTVLQLNPKAWLWRSMVHEPVDNQVVELMPLPMDAPLPSWQAMVGQALDTGTFGEGIRIGVVDSGVGPNLALAGSVKRAVSVAGPGPIELEGGFDVLGHGTMVCGIIGANPSAGSPGFSGIARNAELFMARVFEEGQKTAASSDIAEAIYYLVDECDVDLINLSLGDSTPVLAEQFAIQYAASKGVLCIAAAGNQPSPVLFPAKFKQAAAVSALGLAQTLPMGSVSRQFIPVGPSAGGLVHANGMFVPTFSARGPAVTVAAPGSGVITTAIGTPEDPAPYTEDDGTSMACPVATGCLANWLAANPTYLGLPKGDARRAAIAGETLAAIARQTGFPMINQGFGMVQAPTSKN